MSSTRINHDSTHARIFFVVSAKRTSKAWTADDERAFREAALQVSIINRTCYILCPECDTPQPYSAFSKAVDSVRKGTRCATCRNDVADNLIKKREVLLEKLRNIERMIERERDKNRKQVLSNAMLTQECRDIINSNLAVERRRVRYMTEGRDFNYLVTLPSELDLQRPTKSSLAGWSRAVKKRDQNTCQKCGAVESLQAHHVMSRAEHPHLALDLNNGVALCDVCHDARHTQQT